MAKELTYIPKINSDEVIGREAKLVELESVFESSNATVLITGMGGIGKTTLAMLYMDRHKSGYDRVAWVTQLEDLEGAFAQNKILLDELGLGFLDEDEEDPFARIMSEMRKLDGENLLVIDNVDASIGELRYRQLLPGSNWKILLTSRHKIEVFENLDLAHLNSQDARQLFELDYPAPKEDSSLDALLQFIEYHTLTIELIAKTLKRRRGQVSIDEFFRYLQNQELDAGEIQRKVGIRHQEEFRDQRYVKLYTHLIHTFTFQALEEDQLYLLQQYSVLPPEPQPTWRIREWLRLEPEAEEEFEDALDALIGAGWLRRNGAGKGEAVSIHRMIKEIVLMEERPEMETVELVIVAIMDLLDYERGTSNPIEHFQYAPYGEAILWAIPDLSMRGCGLGTLLGLLYNEMGKYEIAASQLENELMANEKLHGLEHSKTAIAQCNLGSAYLNLDRLEEATQLLEASVTTSLKLGGDKHESTIGPMANLAVAYRQLGRLEAAKTTAEAVLQNAILHYGEDFPSIGILRNNLGGILGEMGDLEGAKEMYEHSLKKNLELFGEDSIAVAEDRILLGICCHEMGLFAEALDLYELALQTQIREYGEDHFLIENVLSHSAGVLEDLGLYDGALKLLEKCHSILLKESGESNIHIASNLSNQGLVYIKLANYEKALELLEGAFQMISSLPGNHPIDINIVHGNLGLAYKEKGELDKAWDLFAKVYETDLAIYGDRHPNLITDMNNLAGLSRDMGKDKEAIGWMESALQLSVETFDEFHPETAQSQSNLAVLYKEAGRLDEGRKLAGKAYNTMRMLVGEEHPETLIMKENLAGYLPG